MGVTKVLSITGYLDIAVLRNQDLNAENSAFILKRAGQSYSMNQFAVVTFDVYNDPNFQVASPIISLTKAGGEILTSSIGFNLVVPAATLDINEGTYYYSLKGDGKLLLTGKFVVSEFPETL